MSPSSLLTGADGRPHVPWRLLLFLVLTSFCVFAAAVTLKPVLTTLEKWSGIETTMESYAATIGLLLAHFIVFRTYDRRPWSFVWLHARAAHWRPIVAGFVLGAAPIGLVSLLLLNVGLLDLERTPDGSSIGLALRTMIILLPAAFSEELLCRGYLFATMREWIGSGPAILATSLGFGLLHLANPNPEVLPIVQVTLAGVYLAVVLLVTESMYAAWIAHFAWNWVMAAFLHIAVSGRLIESPDYQVVDSGPDWITGGAWGPEGGAAAGAGMLGALAYLYWRSRRARALNSSPPQ